MCDGLSGKKKDAEKISILRGTDPQFHHRLPPAHHSLPRSSPAHHLPTTDHPRSPACQVLDAAGKLNCGKATADEQRLMAMGNALRSKGNGKAKGGGSGGAGGGGGGGGIDGGDGGGGGAANGANGGAGGAGGGREGAGRQMQQISSKKENTAVRRAVSAGRVDEALASFNQLRDWGGNIDVSTLQYVWCNLSTLATRHRCRRHRRRHRRPHLRTSVPLSPFLNQPIKPTHSYLLSLLVKTGRFAACSPVIECVAMPPPGENMTPQAAAMLPASFISKLLSEVRSKL